MISGLQIRKILDGKVRGLRTRLVPTPQEGWIRACRDALRMSQGELAHRVGVQQSTIHRLEANELNKKIQLDTLEKLAEAMGCDLYYGFIPRGSFQEMYEAQALKNAVDLENRLRNNMELENQPIKKSDSHIQTTARRLMIYDKVRWK